MTDYLVDGRGGDAQFLFAHGAGAPMDSAFMKNVAATLAENGIEVVRFEFDYMAARRSGHRRPPDRSAALMNKWRSVIEERRDQRPVFIGGKSMGGRIATMVADDAQVDGVICFGYPFHPPGNQEKTRVEHLAAMRTPTLVLQGERDTMGSREEVSAYALSSAIQIAWFEGADHSLSRGRKDGGATLRAAIERAVAFISGILAGAPPVS